MHGSGVAGALVGVAEGGELGVEELGGEGAGEGFDGFALVWGQGCELRFELREFGLADLFGGLLEGLDGGYGVERLEALMVADYFSRDDLLGGGGFAAAVGEVGGGGLLEVVDVVDEAALDLVHLGVDVAGDGDVDEEHGTVAAAVEELAAVGAGEDLLGRAGGGDDDVGAVGVRVEVFEGDDLGRDRLCADGGGDGCGDLLGAGEGAVGDEDGGCALLDQVAGG